MAKRRIGPFEVEPIGFGCMSLSHAYGTPPPRENTARLINRLPDPGCDFLAAIRHSFFHCGGDLLKWKDSP